MNMHIHKHLHSHSYAQLHARKVYMPKRHRKHVCTHTHIHVHARTHTHTHMYLSVNTYIHTYIHTHTQMYSHDTRHPHTQIKSQPLSLLAQIKFTCGRCGREITKCAEGRAIWRMHEAPALNGEVAVAMICECQNSGGRLFPPSRDACAWATSTPRATLSTTFVSALMLAWRSGLQRRRPEESGDDCPSLLKWALFSEASVLKSSTK